MKIIKNNFEIKNSTKLQNDLETKAETEAPVKKGVVVSKVKIQSKIEAEKLAYQGNQAKIETLVEQGAKPVTETVLNKEVIKIKVDI